MKPHKKIGEQYLERWHVIPRNRFFNIYLHRFVGDDDDRALHDHPWWSVSFLVRGQLGEVTSSQVDDRGYACQPYECFRRIPLLLPVIRSAYHAHRLELCDPGKPAWTIFITGPVIREWGFHCPKGWKHWTTMSDDQGNAIGGCD